MLILTHLMLCMIILRIFCRLPKKCKYTNNGCDYERMPPEKQALEEHEKDCQQRTIECPVLTCDQIIPLSRHASHIKDTHVQVKFRTISAVPGEPNTNYKGQFSISNELNTHLGYVFNPVSLTFEDKHFYLECVRTPEGIFYVWIYVIGSSKEHAKFTYTFTILNNNNKVFA